MRIVILGCAGTGKTTLARRLGRLTGVRVICLDDVWQPQWGKEDLPEFRSLVESAHSGEEWISDGNFATATFDLRLPRATMVIWLERSRVSCCRRAIERVFRHSEPDRLAKLLDVLAFIRKFDRINRPLIEAQRAAHGPHVPIRRLTSDKDIALFLRAYGVLESDGLATPRS